MAEINQPTPAILPYVQKQRGTLGKGQCQEPIMGQVSRQFLASHKATIWERRKNCNRGTRVF